VKYIFIVRQLMYLNRNHIWSVFHRDGNHYVLRNEIQKPLLVIY